MKANGINLAKYHQSQIIDSCHPFLITGQWLELSCTLCTNLIWTPHQLMIIREIVTDALGLGNLMSTGNPRSYSIGL